MDARRAAQVMAALHTLYPEAKPELHFRNPFETLIATILSAQCTDKRVNLVTEKLFPLYPDAFAMAKLEPEELEPMIKECGLYHNKAKNNTTHNCYYSAASGADRTAVVACDAARSSRRSVCCDWNCQEKENVD